MADMPRQTPSPVQTEDLASPSPPASTASSPRSPGSLSHKRARSPLSIDLSSVPPLSQPAPPSNTLLITRLEDAQIFHPASLATIREHIGQIAPLYSFSPIKSMHRIICSFYDTDAALRVRLAIDGTAFLGHSVAKCYFGEPTPIGDEKKYLDRPDAGRLFFISPPPSPPVGWEMRPEDPPNKEVHAADLASKLEMLSGKLVPFPDDTSPDDAPVQYTAEELQQKLQSRPPPPGSAGSEHASPAGGSPTKPRSRSSTLIYDPKAHGDSPDLPAVMLEADDDSDVELAAPHKVRAHTARPPVELMEA